jgi:hypothetical protein
MGWSQSPLSRLTFRTGIGDKDVLKPNAECIGVSSPVENQKADYFRVTNLSAPMPAEAVLPGRRIAGKTRSHETKRSSRNHGIYVH